MNKCTVCGRTKNETVEIFGKIAFVECGCAGCIGIEFEPDFKRMGRNLALKQLIRYACLSIGILFAVLTQ